MQTSAKPVDQTTIDAIQTQFYKALSSLKSDTDLKAFLTAFLSETEATVMCKRFAILQMLANGKSYTAIEEELKVSSATVSSISKLAQEPAIANLLKELEADQWASDMSARFMSKFSLFKKKDPKAPVTPSDEVIPATSSIEILEPVADQNLTEKSVTEQPQTL